MLPDSTGPFWPAMFFLMLALPVGVFGAYLATLKRIHWLGMWSADSLAVRWLSGAWLRLLISIGIAFAAAGFLAVRFSVAGWVDIVLVAAAALLVVLLHALIGQRLQGQFKPIFRYGKSLLLIAVVVAIVMSLLDPIVRWFIGAYGVHDSLDQAVDVVRGEAIWLGASSIAQLIGEWGAFWVGLEHFVLGRLLDDQGVLSWLLVIVSGLTRLPLYLAVCFTVCAFLLPAREYTRILQPTQSDEQVESLPPKRIAMASATAIICILFIYLPLAVVFESYLEDHSTVPEPVVVVRHVEQIGEHYFAPGSIEEVNRVAVDTLETHEELLGPIEDALMLGFSLMRSNVDPYLDWYYSLPGEWTRIANLLAGNIEQHLSEKLTEMLELGDPFASFEDTFAEALHHEARIMENFQERADEVLEARRIEVSSEEEVSVVAQTDREALLKLPVHSGLTTVEQRLGMTAATSGVSGVIAAVATRQVILRAASSGAIRAAGAALARLATIRAASMGTGGVLGGVIGGVVGSVLPGAGTAVGAALGGAIGGLAVGVGAEYLILKLEELWSREEHRQKLIAAIDEAEAAVLEQFRQQERPVAPVP